jgi:hypothetical protein
MLREEGEKGVTRVRGKDTGEGEMKEEEGGMQGARGIKGVLYI